MSSSFPWPRAQPPQTIASRGEHQISDISVTQSTGHSLTHPSLVIQQYLSHLPLISLDWSFISKKPFQFVKVIWSSWLYFSEWMLVSASVMCAGGGWLGVRAWAGEGSVGGTGHATGRVSVYSSEDRHGEMERVASHLITQHPSQLRVSSR